VPGCRGFGCPSLARACLSCANKKRVQESSAPFLFLVFIISVSPACPDKFCGFISLADSLAYAENRRNGGLTTFRQVLESESFRKL